MENAAKLLDEVIWCEDCLSATLDAEMLVVMTEWKEFKDTSVDQVCQNLLGNLIFDFRSILKASEYEKMGQQVVLLG